MNADKARTPNVLNDVEKDSFNELMAENSLKMGDVLCRYWVCYAFQKLPMQKKKEEIAESGRCFWFLQLDITAGIVKGQGNVQSMDVKATNTAVNFMGAIPVGLVRMLNKPCQLRYQPSILDNRRLPA